MMFIFKFIFSKIYSFGLLVIKLLYHTGLLKTHSFHKNNVISIGNLSVGGSGKTPMVACLSQILTDLKMSHVVVSRGYKKKSKGEVVVSDGKNILDNYLLTGDEPLMLASMLSGVPVIVGDKARAIYKANKLINYKTIIIDDGFQTFKIKKDINILLLDLSKEKQDYRLLPIGKLRENLSAISRSDVVVFTKSAGSSSRGLQNYLTSFVDSKKQLILESKFRYSVLKYNNDLFSKADCIVKDTVLSFSGIEDSTHFDHNVKKFFLRANYSLVFPDHCSYEGGELKKINSIIRKNNIDAIVTTMKDFVKIKKRLKNINIYVLHVECSIENKTALVDLLNLLKN